MVLCKEEPGMATRNLERDKARFAEWRRRKQGREPIPEELWQIAAAHIGGLSVNRVSREFRLSFSRLRQKAQEFGIDLPKSGTEESRRNGGGFPGAASEEHVCSASFSAVFVAGSGRTGCGCALKDNSPMRNTSASWPRVCRGKCDARFESFATYFIGRAAGRFSQRH